MNSGEEIILYIHGKGGTAAEADHYRTLLPGHRVVGMEYNAETPWEAKAEFPGLLDALCREESRVILIANSIGAYLAMCSLPRKRIEKAYFISPIVDMEKLIGTMMTWAGVSEQELQAKGEIPTSFGETLSWAYLNYVRSNPIRWNAPTRILYAAGDHLTDADTITRFAEEIHAPVTVMENGEHWFHTPEQMAFLDGWLRRNI